jgi:hypothetical protein
MSARWKYPSAALVSLFTKALADLPESDREKFAGWRLVVDTGPRGHRYGQCRYREKELSVSAWLISLNGEDHPQVNDTLRHEMAHVLTGPGHGHDYLWRANAAKLGASTSRTVSEKSAAQVKSPPGWVGHCRKCGEKTSPRPGKPRKTHFCRKCFDKNRRNGVSRFDAHKDCIMVYRKELR